MDPTPPPEPTPEDAQEQMRDTRGHMTGQMHALEDKVTGMVRDAASAVDDASHGVQDAVRAATARVRGASASVLAHVRGALDVRGHVRRHPWLAVGCAAALGFACMRLVGRRL
jgi:ElaB/YqjD/DUF883 family membrane-anchored ribosome-binding protein